ncbi:hypothetical protein HY251_02195 [bacterium]|nr:hypothetical protein [bacterium]
MIAGGEPRPSRKRAVVLALVLVLVALAAPLASSTVREGIEVRWLARSLRSRDPEVREETRVRLLAIGRPAIDPVFPEIVAGLVVEADSGWIFLGRVRDRTPEGTTYEHENTALDREKLFRVQVSVLGEPGFSRSARMLFRSDARRELVLGHGASAHPMGRQVEIYALQEARVMVPLDDELAPAVIEAVKKKLEETSYECPACEVSSKTPGVCPQCDKPLKRRE